MDRRYQFTEIEVPPPLPEPPTAGRPGGPVPAAQTVPGARPLLSEVARAQLARIAAGGKLKWGSFQLPDAWTELVGHGLIQVTQLTESLLATPTPLGLRSCALALQSSLLNDQALESLETLYSQLGVKRPKHLESFADRVQCLLLPGSSR